MNQQEFLAKLFTEEEVKAIVKHFFDYDVSEGQEEIIRTILYQKKNRITISAMTRYGKTHSIATGASLLILFNPGIKIALIGPKAEQARILRDYMVDRIMACSLLRDIVELEGTGLERLKKEATKNRQTFKNGAEYRVFSAHHDANRLMGFGADIIIADEACLIGREAYTKIFRMAGDNPEGSIIILSYNPWDTDNIAYEASINPDWHHIHIGYQQAIQEGRTTKEFVEEQKAILPPLAFTVLYESDFPEQSEDAIFSLAWIRDAIKNEISIWDEIKALRERIEDPGKPPKELKQADHNTWKERQVSQAKRELEEYKIIVACDPADKGLDKTVITWGCQYGNEYQQLGIYSEATSDNMNIASKVWHKAKEIGATHIHVDGHGLGIGVLSRLKQLKDEDKAGIQVKSCLFGNPPSQRKGSKADPAKLFRNSKAENYWRLRDIMKDQRIKLIENQYQNSELLKMKWEYDGKEKIKVVDPEDKSPDYADALVYLIWRDSQTLKFSFSTG